MNVYYFANDIVLNRALLTGTADSRVLRSGSALVHPFPEPGTYEVAVYSRDTPRSRFQVEVAAGEGLTQVTVDVVPGDEESCQPTGGPRYLLRTGGSIVFHQSFGSAPTSVRITRLTNDDSQPVVDTADRLRAGEVYTLTLARPGDYLMEDQIGDHRLGVRVEPMEAGPSRQPVLVTLDDGGFEPSRVRLTAGQTLAVVLEAHGRLVTTSTATRD